MCLCIIWKLRLDLCWTAVYFSTRVNSNFHKKAVFICFTGGSIATIHHKEQFISIVIYLVSKCEQFIFYREGFLERWARRQINFDISPNQIQYELYSMGKQGTKQYKKNTKRQNTHGLYYFVRDQWSKGTHILLVCVSVFVIERPKQVLTKRRNVRESTELTDGFSKKLSLGGKMSRNKTEKWMDRNNRWQM